jgi:hypothetical protein
MSCILNIGLGPSKVRPQGQDLGTVLDAVLRLTNSAYIEFRTIENGEPTVIVVAPNGMSTSTIYRLAERLDQDCIAAVRPMGNMLVGPLAAEWGEFKPEHFLMPSRRVVF